MTSKQQKAVILSATEIDILQEVMNISFGKASADLADIINIKVLLSVPKVEMLNAGHLPARIAEETSGEQGIYIIEQNYWGKFQGTALLIFPTSFSQNLLELFEENEEASIGMDPGLLERETLLEIGNILIGACIGKISELLKDIISYSPPKIMLSRASNPEIFRNLSENNEPAIFMKTLFKLQEHNLSGYLFLISGQESMAWLKKALNDFLAKFG
ncbi:MAG: hypothetical protein A2511_02110 [Deltaproteobacteria bacterium RIFOXYD12_FULL_50_9]|nr:MAG: hypothetical protein A2511_02110 [Deltaproteobacteria bacterium RIFOXYD12_FULL_50_9]